MRLFLALPLLALLAPACFAGTEPAPVPPQLKAFLMQPDQQLAIKQIVGMQWSKLVAGCTGAQAEGANILVEYPPAFDASGKPISGQWRVVVHVSGCDQTRIFNILYGFDKNGKMVRWRLLPGTTLADFRLQKDGLLYAAMGMAKLTDIKHCKDVQFTNTAFVAFGKGEPGHRPWTEKWTVQACGTTGLVKMHFIPDAKGTTISTSPKETKRVTVASTEAQQAIP